MANITKVYLLSVPLENDYKDTLYFANATAQHDYFAGQVVKSYTDFSYQRKDSVIRVPAIVDSIRNCNYVMYQNSAYSNKWFYAFINRMVYVDDKRTDIYISTDVLQTWMFEMEFKDSFIEREHVNDDTVGKHTLPEGLETGDYVCNDVVNFRYANTYNSLTSSNSVCVCVQVTSLVFKYGGNNNTEPVEYFTSTQPYNVINSVPQGCYIIAIPLGDSSSLSALWSLHGLYAGGGRSDCIVSMFLLPMQMLGASYTPYVGHGSVASQMARYCYCPQDSEGPVNLYNIDAGPNVYDFAIPINSTLDGYTPHNGKCKVAPYNYFTITNNDGVDISFSYEDFLSTPTFRVRGSFEQGGNFMCLPYNSKKTTTSGSIVNGWTEGIPGGKFPQVSWTSDYYLNWQAQNGKYIETSLNLAGMELGANLLTGMIGGATGNFGSYNMANLAIEQAQANPRIQEREIERLQTMPGANPSGGVGMFGAITNFAGQVANVMQQQKVARMTPQQAKGNASVGTLAFSSNATGRYTAYKMSCRYEYIKAIDSYFDMFGYKVNRLGKPLKNHRQNWWYTKTVSANIDGNIPNEDMEIIKGIYNSGVTYWKNPANIKNYSVSNNIVS